MELGHARLDSGVLITGSRLVVEVKTLVDEIMWGIRTVYVRLVVSFGIMGKILSNCQCAIKITKILST